MNALTQYHIRQAALEAQLFNPMANVFVPDEPDWKDVVDAKVCVLLNDCARRSDMAALYADSHEVLLQRTAEILHRTGEAYAAMQRRWSDDKARKDELAALGADLLRIVMEDLRGVAVYELERER